MDICIFAPNTFFMKILKYLFLLLAAFSLASCGDDDETVDDTNKDDPRIRAVKIVNISQEFVVNDVENVIFNYDSLSKGTKVDALNVYFYGYISSPSIYYKTDVASEWKSFVNGDKIDMSSSLFILSISNDGKHRKEYKFDLRIHKYDVDAFTWKKFSTIKLSSEVVSQKSLTMNNAFYWFCKTASGNNYQYTSSDKGKTWTRKSLSVSDPVWETLSLYNDSLWVQLADGSLVSSALSTLDFQPVATSVSIDRLLFEVNGSLWAISGRSIYALSPTSSDFELKNELPDEFSTESIVTFTAASGFTQLGYIYAVKDDAGSIWSLDYKGALCLLKDADGSLPALTNPMVYIYDRTLGIVGGRLSDGSISTKCYSSQSSGKNWTLDAHKDLSNNVGGIEYAGVFAFSGYGELIVVGGNTADGPSNVVWKGVLNQLNADDLNYND